MAPFELNSKFIEHIVDLANGLQDKALPALFDLALGIIVIRLLVRGARLLLKLTHIQLGLRYVLTSIFESFLWVLLVIALLQELGLNNIIFFFTGSIAAIGIAMAAGGSTLVADVIAAIFLAQDKDFNVGDEVKVGWDPVTQGVIERMDARRIRIRDKDGILHVIPNSTVERKEWVVIKRRTELTAGAVAANTARKIKAVALEKGTTLTGRSKKPRKNDQ